MSDINRVVMVGRLTKDTVRSSERAFQYGTGDKRVRKHGGIECL